MKQRFVIALLVAGLFNLTSCGNKPTEEAKDVNEERIEERTENTSGDTNAGVVDNATGNNREGRMEDAADMAVEVAHSNMFEIEYAKVAATKATHPEVKKFAAMMATEHGMMSKDLMAYVTKKGLTVPSQLNSAEQDEINDSRNRTGHDFDEDYIETMVKHHKKDLETMEDIIEDNKDAELVAVAQKALPKIKMHLAEAQKLESLLDTKDDGKTAAGH